MPSKKLAPGPATTPHIDETEQDETAEDTPPLLESSPESVWLFAGRTDSSYAALVDVVSGVGSDEEAGCAAGGGEGRGDIDECLAHMVTIGPSAQGGETAAVGRLKR